MRSPLIEDPLVCSPDTLHPGNILLDARDMGLRNSAGPQKHQAVMTSADQAVFYRCRIDAYHDTLYAYSNCQFYRECNINGTVDFIFGNSTVVIQNCNIRPKLPMAARSSSDGSAVVGETNDAPLETAGQRETSPSKQNN
ncbi:putative pectinesterase/pectinesterase inhibitor 24 [Vigna umbellata]|uniref:putative pectinesterase/pectinesterase inhibitor 24 n=1 Tax=Vigna umbellata TaxID=87088 RepID=UPI001F5FA22F|nr:putative pectinesterase/pectinesterase inhibitor 24 [Vigna umbellata]